MRLSLYKTQCVDPYRNLACERYLLESVKDDQIILYLWQNQNTVVIGRNQSALAECRVQKLKEDGGQLVRRLSGGGAVFHDLGNLNFTFLVPSALFSEEKQTRVILEAVRLLGVHAQRTGRNDLLVEGAKFSGHAYYHTKGHSYHHGTLLVNTDSGKMAKYLNPSPLKLSSKGVSSVASRVCNLKDFIPDLSIHSVEDALEQAFSQVYDGRIEQVSLNDAVHEMIEVYRAQFASEDWVLKGERLLEKSVEARFDWGCVRVDWDEYQQVFKEVSLFSDGLDADFLDAIPAALRGCSVDENSIHKALETLAENTPGSTSEEKQLCISDLAQVICSGRS